MVLRFAIALLFSWALIGLPASAQISADEREVQGPRKQSCLDAKLNKDYGPKCILIMYIDSPFPIPRNITEIVSGVSRPERSPFMRIYLTGEFPRDGYQCWPVT